MNYRQAPHPAANKGQVSPSIILEFYNVADSKLLCQTPQQNNSVYNDIVLKVIYLLNE